jgi:tetratricopeptide (TPR) repeat protein
MFACGVALLCCVTTARADWFEASSDHFVIYSDQGEKSLRGFAEHLELYHAAMAHMYGSAGTKPSPSNRVTIFTLADEKKIQELSRRDNRYVAGFYQPRAGACTALVPRLRSADSQFALSAETVLYHEYAHHFMSLLTERSYPSWFVEGFAEFFAGVKFTADSVGLGAPALHRAYELAYSKDVPIRTMLDFAGAVPDNKTGYEAFYGQSWALYHYLTFAPERAGQLRKYEQLLQTGDTALQAAEGAFGDLDRLAKDLDAYTNKARLSYYPIRKATLPIGPIEIRPVSAGEAEIMMTRLRTRLGVTHEEALAVVTEARRVAILYPTDASVLTELSEAEVDAGNFDAAVAAADRALAIDPKRVDAYIQKGLALAGKIRAGALPADSWKDVRSQFVKANRVENDHPVPLMEFYLAYRDQGIAPPRNAVQGLEWAMTLAPYDPSLRWMAAQQMIDDERLDDAIATLAPLAYSPHPGEHTSAALALLEQIKARKAAKTAGPGPANASPN